MAGPNTRTTQVFINFGDNASLDGLGFAPFGHVVAGMEVVDKLNAEYGEGAPRGRGPDQGRMQMEGNAYLKKDFRSSITSRRRRSRNSVGRSDAAGLFVLAWLARR